MGDLPGEFENFLEDDGKGRLLRNLYPMVFIVPVFNPPMHLEWIHVRSDTDRVLYCIVYCIVLHVNGIMNIPDVKNRPFKDPQKLSGNTLMYIAS